VEKIYVRLLDEGTEVYRPVAAVRIAPAIYLISAETPYDTETESWEFAPGSRVLVVEKTLSEAKVLVAVSLSP
jgi:hypothetical protein